MSDSNKFKELQTKIYAEALDLVKDGLLDKKHLKAVTEYAYSTGAKPSEVMKEVVEREEAAEKEFNEKYVNGSEQLILEANELYLKGLISKSSVVIVATRAWTHSTSVVTAMNALGLRLLHDAGDPERIVREVIENNKYAFCTTVVGAMPIENFFGLCLKHSKGKANPTQLKEHLLNVIEEWKINKSNTAIESAVVN